MGMEGHLPGDHTDYALRPQPVVAMFLRRGRPRAGRGTLGIPLKNP